VTPLGELSPAWRDRWAADAERYGQAPIPTSLDDPENAGLPYARAQAHADERASVIAHDALDRVLPLLTARDAR
jgi:hypothetical protein